MSVSSMAIIFVDAVNFIVGKMFHFGSISCIADQSGTLHRTADAEKKSEGQMVVTSIRKGHLLKSTIAPTMTTTRPQPNVASPQTAPTHLQFQASKPTIKLHWIITSSPDHRSTSTPPP
jgi:hypothetical protein